MFVIVTTAVNVTVVTIWEEWWWERILSNASNNYNLSFFDSFLYPLIFPFSLSLSPSFSLRLSVCLSIRSMTDINNMTRVYLSKEQNHSYTDKDLLRIGNQSIRASTFYSIICLRSQLSTLRSECPCSRPNRFFFSLTMLLNTACPCSTDNGGIET